MNRAYFQNLKNQVTRASSSLPEWLEPEEKQAVLQSLSRLNYQIASLIMELDAYDAGHE